MFTNKTTKKGYSVLLLGVAGVGKTRLAIRSNKPVLIDIENGGDQFKDVLKIDRSKNKLASLDDIITALRAAVSSDKIQTIILDSITEINKIIEEEILIEMNIKSLSANYGAGYGPLNSKWNKLIDVIEKIRSLGKNIIVIGHNKQTKIYDSTIEQEILKEELHIHSRVLENIKASFYGIYFLRYQKVFDRQSNRPIATGNRELITRNFNETIICKNRYSTISDTVIFNNNSNEDLINFWEEVEKNV